MLFKFSLLLSFALLQITIGDDSKSYKLVVDCQSKFCQQYYKINAEQMAGCQTGCNYLLTGVDCETKCDEDKKQTILKKDACKAVCNKKSELVEQKEPAPAKQEDKTAVETSLNDVIGALKNEKDGVSDLFDKLFNGKPQSNDDLASIVKIEPLDSKADEDDSSSSSEESKEKPSDKANSSSEEDSVVKSSINIVDPSDSLDQNSFGFSPKRLFDIISHAMSLARDKFGSKEPQNFVYSAKIENGKLVENIEKQSSGEQQQDDDLTKLLNSINYDKQVDEIPLYNRLPAGSKGRPLPIGKPIVEQIDSSSSFEHGPHILRECRPVSFHFKTLCSDLNNFFNCVSMRTGLPRWFFLSLILLCSFFMIWLGLFILSMIRRMKRQERVIYYEEDQLPLYKDIVIEEKVPPTYEAEELPEKVKLESI